MPTISKYGDEHFAGVEALWQEAFPNDAPWNKASTAIAEKMRFQPDLMLVALEGPRVVGSVMAGYEGHRGWISYLGVAPEHRRKGLGRAIMAEAERRLREAGCPKINLQVRSTNSEVIEFYRQIGFVLEDVVNLGKRLEEDGPRPG
jgi:ribosomal protein S18 acetylase RimI-like enzyme